MKRALALILVLLGPGSPVWAADDLFAFYQQEAMVQTGSHQPQRPGQVPGTVYVVTAQDIKDSGALTIWDALRAVPGLDVMSTRTFQGEVSIRGLNRPIVNRTLVLLDGKTVLNGYYDYLTWASLPVTIDEIDRIEVLEGPASAVYGANAISGVINIITKTPAQLHGGIGTYTGGERNTQIGSFVYGTQKDHWGYKLGSGWQATNRFEDASRPSAEAGKFDALVRYQGPGKNFWSASGGVTNYETDTTTGGTGAVLDQGLLSFLRTDARVQDTQVRAFWNHGRTFPDAHSADLVSIEHTFIDFDTYDANLEQFVALPWRNDLVLGGNIRKNTARSSTFPPGFLAEQNLWALFMEDKWEINDQWILNGSGRLDHHPFTSYQFSPRGSLIYTPVPEQTFRVSGGTSFRQPTLLENNLDVALTASNPGQVIPPFPPGTFNTLAIQQLGNQMLAPERIEEVEVAHRGQFGRVKTDLAGFHYRLTNMINSGPTTLVGADPLTGVISMQRSFINQGDVVAWGAQGQVDVPLFSWLTSFANYTYQYLYDDPGPQITSLASPRHKANFGLRAKQSGWTGNLVASWVDKTIWATVNDGGANDLAPVNAYWLLNAHVGYAFGGKWEGLDIGVNAFNLLNHDHFEVLPAQGPLAPGQSGEIIKQRWTGTISYRFR